MTRIISRPLFMLLMLVISGNTLFAQPGVKQMQQEWLMSLRYGQDLQSYQWDKGYFLYINDREIEAGDLREELKALGMDRPDDYIHHGNFRHDNHRYFTVGMLEAPAKKAVLLTGWKFTANGWKKETDVLLPYLPGTSEGEKKADLVPGENLSERLDEEREEWVRLANLHDPAAHIRYSYTPDAEYYSGGQNSEGHAGIAERYSYMENPQYQVDLEKERLWKISDQQVLEVGRYFTGAERRGTGGLYTILWEKQPEGEWKIAMDYNF